MQDAGTVLEVLRDRSPVANAAQSLESPVH